MDSFYHLLSSENMSSELKRKLSGSESEYEDLDWLFSDESNESETHINTSGMYLYNIITFLSIT